MRAYTIKRTGKTILQNMCLDKEMIFSDDSVVYAQFLFFRKKDAQKYLNSFEHKEYFEVVGVTIDKSDKDNRKR